MGRPDTSKHTILALHIPPSPAYDPTQVTRGGVVHLRPTTSLPCVRLYESENGCSLHRTDITSRNTAVMQTLLGCPGRHRHGNVPRTAVAHRHLVPSGARQWWADLHRWAQNDIPPGISENDTPNKQRAYIHSKMLHTLHELRQARQLRDTQRVQALQSVWRDSAQQVGLPLHVAGTVVVPNLSTIQKTVITNILRWTLCDSTMKAYEHHAVRHTVRIVRSNPHTVRSVFQSKAMAQSRLMKKTPCRCAEFQKHASEYGEVIDVDGHIALVPVALNVGGHGGLRTNDLVPVPGHGAGGGFGAGLSSAWWFCTVARHAGFLQTEIPSTEWVSRL